MIAFPDGFVFGTATSAHQVEGENRFNDWWEWEAKGRVPFRSGKACDHWNLYRDDIKLMAELGYRGYRFSIEWSRIFPEEDKIDERALSRYSEMVELLRRNGIEPMITLHHFTNPIWFNRRGGWLREENIEYFIRLVEIVADTLKSVEYWVVFNEPNVYILQGFILGVWPPGYKGISKGEKALKNIIKAHAEAYSILKKRGVYVGVAQNLIPFKPGSMKKGDVEKARLVDETYNWSFIDGVMGGGFAFFRRRGSVQASELNFIGVNYYSAYMIKRSWNPFKLFIDVKPLKTDIETTMGYYIYPRGIYEVVKAAKKRAGKSIVITENGVAVDNDEIRIVSIVRHLQYLHKAVNEGVDVNGYYYWSFMDNYEWDKGYTQRFGLVEVDYETLKRKPRKSAYIYGEIARTNTIGEELIEKYGLNSLD